MDFINKVKEKTNRITVHKTKESEKPQIEDASSIIKLSFSHFKHFDTEPVMLNSNL